MKTLKNFENQAIKNLQAIKGGNAESETKEKKAKADDVVTEEITFVVEDMQIA